MKLPFIILASAVVVAGCAQRNSQNLAACTAEAGISGKFSTVYTIDGGTSVVPGPNVSDAQARSANDCMARSASATKPGLLRRSSSVPSEYPLLPGDAALWQSMSPEQQLRALEFLRDGSTIRSSLQPD